MCACTLSRVNTEITVVLKNAHFLTYINNRERANIRDIFQVYCHLTRQHLCPGVVSPRQNSSPRPVSSQLQGRKFRTLIEFYAGTKVERVVK